MTRLAFMLSVLTLSLSSLSSVVSCQGHGLRQPKHSSKVRSFYRSSASAFATHPRLSLTKKTLPFNQRQHGNPSAIVRPLLINPSHTIRSSSTQIQMSYNLPPGNDNKGGTPFEDILPGIVTAVGLTLFFLSPLGGIFFAVTNTLFVLALVTPVLIYAGFQIWSKLNIIEGSCPSCNAPVVVLKSDEGQPSVCLSCGASVRATKDKKSVELCSGTSMDDIFFQQWDGE